MIGILGFEMNFMSNGGGGNICFRIFFGHEN